MPLMSGKSPKAFEHNISAEMSAGKPQKQALAIAYAVKRRNKKMAHGGMYEDGGSVPDKKKDSPGLMDRLGDAIDHATGNDKPSAPSKPTGSHAGSDTGAKKLGEGWSKAGFAEGGEVEDHMLDVEDLLLHSTPDEEPEELKGHDAHQAYAMGGMHPKHVAHMIMSKGYAHGGEAADDLLAPDVEQDEPIDSDDEELRHKRILSQVMSGLHKKHSGK